MKIHQNTIVCKEKRWYDLKEKNVMGGYIELGVT